MNGASERRSAAGEPGTNGPFDTAKSGTDDRPRPALSSPSPTAGFSPACRP